MEDIAKQDPKEQVRRRKEKDSTDIATYAESKGAARTSVLKEDRKEAIKEQGNENDARVHATSVESSYTAQTIAGPQVEEREVKEELI